MSEFRKREGEFDEGRGTDKEDELTSEEQMQLNEEVDNFRDSWTTTENGDLLERVIEKMRAVKKPEDALKEIGKIDNQLIDTMGDEELQKDVLEKYLGKNSSKVEDDEESWEEAA